MARRAKGFMPPEEGDALYRAACDAGPGTFVEIGTYCAKSAIYVGAAARQVGSVLFTIDHHRGSEEMQPGWLHHDPEVVDPVAGTMDSLPFARLHLSQAGLEDHVVLVVGRSDQVARHWPGPVQFLFVDGGHGAEVAAADFAAWVPKVPEGGVLAVHDVFEDPDLGGQVPFELYRACVEPSGPGAPRFVEVGRCGSLRVARRCAEPAF